MICDSPTFQRRNVDWGSISWGLEAGPTKGNAVDKMLAIGGDLVSTAQAALLSILGNKRPNAIE